MTDELSAQQAATYLDISRAAVDKAIRENRLATLSGDGPARLSLQVVEEFHQARQAVLIAQLGRSGETPVSVAQKVRARLFAAEKGMPRPFAATLSAMPADWRALFSRAELAAACVRDGEGCRWCKAAEFAEFLGQRPPTYAEAYVELFGGQPCGRCGPGLLAPFWEAMRARVHAGAVRPSERPVAPSAAERERAREWALQRPVTAAVRPVGDDGGKALVAKHLRQARARLKDAKRRGDQRHALQLAQTIRGLEQDAARVDGRAVVTAAARPGTLRCGHPLADGCSCPRRGSKPVTAAGGAAQRQPHGCGCDCPEHRGQQ